MKVIRKGVFETNSSSTHSICISDKGDVVNTLYVDENGKCSIPAGEFGWGYENYNDAATKASYCLTHVKSHVVEGREEFLRSVIQEVTGAKEVEFVPTLRKGEKSWGHPAPEDEWGYIDHQSIEDGGGVGEEAFNSFKTLRNFIFNANSELTIDNDNH